MDTFFTLIPGICPDEVHFDQTEGGSSSCKRRASGIAGVVQSAQLLMYGAFPKICSRITFRNGLMEMEFRKAKMFAIGSHRAIDAWQPSPPAPLPIKTLIDLEPVFLGMPFADLPIAGPLCPPPPRKKDWTNKHHI
jgi:hypothetical protein